VISKSSISDNVTVGNRDQNFLGNVKEKDLVTQRILKYLWSSLETGELRAICAAGQ
jgi:hypothetical protein